MMRSVIRDISQALSFPQQLLIALLIAAAFGYFYSDVGNVIALSFLGGVIAFLVIIDAFQVTRRGSEKAWRSWLIVSFAFTGGLILAAALTSISSTAIIGIAFGGAIGTTATAAVADALYLRDEHKKRSSPS
jgi:membrane associated rhomboid family serine protease